MTHVGIDGHFVIGRPAELVATADPSEAGNYRLEVIAPDAQGNPVTFQSPSQSVADGGAKFSVLFQSGQLRSGLTVRLVSEDGTVRARKVLSPGGAGDGISIEPLVPMEQLVATIGQPAGLTNDEENGGEESLAFTVLEISPPGLPDNPRGLGCVRTICIAGGYSDLNAGQVAGLRDWVRFGGHLVISVADKMDSYLAGPLGRQVQNWIPLDAQTQRISELPALESYAGNRSRVPLARRKITAAKIGEHSGVNLVSGTDGPLVASAGVGFGRVTIVGVDIATGPVSKWTSLPFLMRKLLFGQRRGVSGRNQSSRMVHTGISDLSTQLNASLENFPEIKRPTSWIVMGLMVLYLLVIGPLDYFLAHKILKRPRLTWVTFPLWVAAGCWIGLTFAENTNGDEVRLNQIAIADIDATGSQAYRLRSWSSVYTPRARRAAMKSQPQETFLGAVGAKGVDPTLLKWTSVPENTFGGLLRSTGFGLGSTDYRVDQNATTGVPFGQWSTRSVQSDWLANATPPVETDLTTSGDLLRGTVRHDFPFALRNWIIAHGYRAYHPNPMAGEAARIIAPGDVLNLTGTTEIFQDKTAEARTVDKVLQRDLQGFLTRMRVVGVKLKPGEGGQSTRNEIEPYDALNRDPSYVVQMLSLHRSAGGTNYTGLTNTLLSEVDLTEVVRLNQAVLIAEVEPPAAHLSLDDEPLKPTTTRTFVRIMLPVKTTREIVPTTQPIDRSTAENTVIETKNLTKRYGDLIAVNNINLNLEKGDVFGFIGPNGSGKTTTMRMICTLLNPDHGEAYVCGKSIYTNQEEIRRLVGFMPDFFGVYDDMTVIEYLEFFAAAYRIKGSDRRKVAEEKLELVDMTFKRDAMVSQLSRGQTQRIGLARTLLHEPQVLLLDEPASGLDPRARIEMRGLLKRLGEMDKTVIVSSHILPELADVCTRVGMIEKGNLIVDGNVAEVMRKARERIVLNIEVSADTEKAAKFVTESGAAENVRVDGETIVVTLKPEIDDYSFLPTKFIENGFALKLFREEEVNLETAFMELTKGVQQ